MSDTYEEKRKKEIWIRQNQAGLYKRFCTLELCFRPGPDQPKPGAVFRGKGTRISAVEKAAWDERVHVMFQEKAWVDGKTNDSDVNLQMQTDTKIMATSICKNATLFKIIITYY